MATFISLINWTEEGIQHFADTVKRADDAKALAQRMGGSLEHIYWTVGQYDLVTVAEFPDDQTATAFLLAVGAQGHIRTTTLRAYNAGEVSAIVGKVT
jgi:uncharacterized protein with GYD domain